MAHTLQTSFSEMEMLEFLSKFHAALGNDLAPDSIQRCHLTSIGNPIVVKRQSYDRL